MSQFLMKFLGESTSSQRETTADPSKEDRTAKVPEPPRDADLYSNLKKNSVLLDARCFDDKQISESKCRLIISKIVYLLNQGEKLSDAESTPLYFGMTKLFQSENYDLRRMIYVMIREMSREPNIFIMTASLIKDINSKVDLFKMNALRLAPVILSAQTLTQSERFIKQVLAIIDKNPAVSCAALMAGVHLCAGNIDLVKKWVNEISDKLNSKSPSTQYHALILMREIKKSDKNSFLKVLVNLTKENITNALASIQLIRFIREFVIEGELDTSNERIFVEFLNKQLHKNSEMVVFEAAKTLCEFKSLPNKELAPCISVLSLFFSSSSSINKFSALRIVNKLITNPSRISLMENNSELDSLLRDNNKSLSAFAISILLKTSKEDNVEQLLTQIEEYISEASDEFKIDIISSIRALARKHASKYKSIINFLSHCLKNEGHYEFKSACVSCLETVIKEIPESKDVALFTLAEFIEDCQYQVLHIQVMNLLAREAGNIQHPTKFIRLINNRVALENPDIRAAALTTLGKFALDKHHLIQQIRPIIENSLEDPDSEVRARGLFYLAEIEKIESREEDAINLKLSLQDVNYIEAFLQSNLGVLQKSSDPEALDISNINQYIKSNNIQITQNVDTRKKVTQQQNAIDLDNSVMIEKPVTQNSAFLKYQELFANNPMFEGIGELRQVNDEKTITDANAEYPVILRKIFFTDFIILEFNVSNTLENHILSDVTLEISPIENENLKIIQIIAVKQIKTNEKSSIYVIIAKNPECRILTTNIQSILKFKVSDITNKGKSNTYEDEYPLEDFQINANDYLRPSGIPVDKKFEAAWKTMPNGVEADSSYQLEYKTLGSAIEGLIKHFGANVCENSDIINTANKVHTLMMSATYLGYEKVLLQALIGFQAEKGCVMKLKAKSADENLVDSIINCIS